MYIPTGTSPWMSPSPWTSEGDSLLEFCVAQAGAGDVLVLCDGRSKEARQKIDSVLLCLIRSACFGNHVMAFISVLIVRHLKFKCLYDAEPVTYSDPISKTLHQNHAI